jgi:hypothetical protein
MLCKVEGCQRPVRTSGFCQAHYLRVWRHGSPKADSPLRGVIPAAFIAQAVLNSGPDCLLWPYGQNGVGYGSIRWDGRQRTVHSVVCELTHGPKPSSKHEVAHSCGNRICCAPAHLRWATIKENQADRLIHGTHNRGERQGQSKLTANQVQEIRAQQHRLQRDLAADYGVTDRTISDIQRRTTWRHIP